MKAAAQEEKARKALEQAQLLKEREVVLFISCSFELISLQKRVAAVKDKEKMAKKLEKFRKAAAQAQRDLLRSEETAQLLAEKVSSCCSSRFVSLNEVKVEIAEVETGVLLRQQQEVQEAIDNAKREATKVDSPQCRLL